jgi:hypothetical protein
MVWDMVDNKIILIQLWIGKIPDYFWHHYETTKNLKIDFLFVTDQDISLNSQNYKIIKTTKNEIEKKLSHLLGTNFRVKTNKKVCDLKAAFGHLFEEHIREYDYFGCYDIDTFFGDVNKYVTDYLGEYDFISIGDGNFHDRLAGPFLIIRNIDELRKLYINSDFIQCFESEEVECYEEKGFSDLVRGKYKIKLIDEINLDLSNGKNTYDAYWSGGKVFVENKEKLLYHFYRKDKTKIDKIGNLITATCDKVILDDFYWVVGFTKNYENLFINLLGSIKKYSNRKCIVYSINYDYIQSKFDLSSDQFIIRRIDIPEGDKDSKGRDINIITSKPLINLDAINAFPGKKFVNIDSDIYFTVNSDDIFKYFKDLDNYPLINSHIHDVIYISGINPEEEWTSSLHVLANAMGVSNEIFPRRKTNIVLFDCRSEWFFKEQMDLYSKYKGKAPGILAVYDEDTANALIWKYDLKKCLPLVDIEEVDTIDMEKFHSYSYSMTVNISPSVVIPKNINEVLFFHAIKSQEHYNDIRKNYGSSVIDCEEFVVKYSNNTLLFEKNSFMSDKRISGTVDFIIGDLDNNEIHRLGNQNFYGYWYFYISNLFLEPKKYSIKIFETDTNRCIFNDILNLE